MAKRKKQPEPPPVPRGARRVRVLREVLRLPVLVEGDAGSKEQPVRCRPGALVWMGKEEAARHWGRGDVDYADSSARKATAD